MEKTKQERICKKCGTKKFADYKGRKICAKCGEPRYKLGGEK